MLVKNFDGNQIVFIMNFAPFFANGECSMAQLFI